MTKSTIVEVLRRKNPFLNGSQLQRLETVLDECTSQDSHEATTLQKQELVHRFLAVKRGEGCSEKTLKYYDFTLRKALAAIQQPMEQITTEDLRRYLDDYQRCG